MAEPGLHVGARVGVQWRPTTGADDVQHWRALLLHRAGHSGVADRPLQPEQPGRTEHVGAPRRSRLVHQAGVVGLDLIRLRPQLPALVHVVTVPRITSPSAGFSICALAATLPRDQTPLPRLPGPCPSRRASHPTGAGIRVNCNIVPLTICSPELNSIRGLGVQYILQGNSPGHRNSTVTPAPANTSSSASKYDTLYDWTVDECPR